MQKKKLLILCTANSCRSQIAEGAARHYLGDRYDVFSAGVAPSFVHPTAIAVMGELGIDMSQQYSKSVTELLDHSFDIVVTVCDNAKDTCPVLPGDHTTYHWPFEDPAAATGSNDEILNKFRRIRDEIIQKFRSELE